MAQETGERFTGDDTDRGGGASEVEGPCGRDASGRAGEFLREPRGHVSKRATAMWRLQAVVLQGGPASVQLGWWALDRHRHLGWHLALAAVWLLVAVTYVTLMPGWRWRVHRWEATDSAVYTQTGWVSQQRRIAPMSRVQTVDLERGPVAQLFGLACVTVTTASAAGPLRIDGLDLQVATELVETLSAAAVPYSGDAT